MKKQLLVSATALALMMPYAAMADVNYNFVELDYIMADDDDADADAIRLKGSLEFGGGVYGLLEYGTQDNDIDTISLGVGYGYTVADGTDIYGALSVEHIEPDVIDGETGFGVRAGVRSLIIPELELRGGIRHVDNDFFMDDDPTLLELGVQYLPIPQVGIVAEYWADVGSDDGHDSILVGARYNF